MLTLYYSPDLCSIASHIVLEEIGCDYDARRVAFKENEQHGEAFRALNPRGRVPVLVGDDGTLTETVAILTFLGNYDPDRPLLPENPWMRAQCLSRMAWYADTVHNSFAQYARPERFTTDAQCKPELSDAGKERFWQNCQLIDGYLDGGKWAIGNEYSVADPYTLVFYIWGLRARLPMNTLGRYSVFAERMMERPAARGVLESEDSILLRQGPAV